jgi:hypothetical protein
VILAPTACPGCGSTALAKLGEDVTETLEVIPRQWKVVQHARAAHLPALRGDQPSNGVGTPFDPRPSTRRRAAGRAPACCLM